jgi:hypothetical protein
MSVAFLRIGWLSAVVGEAWLQKPPHKTPTTGVKINADYKAFKEYLMSSQGFKDVILSKDDILGRI